MNNSTIAHILIFAVAPMPPLLTFLSAKYYVESDKYTRKWWAAFFIGLFAVFGTIFIQFSFLKAFSVSVPDAYLRRLMPLQFTVALIGFFWRLNKKT